MSAKQTSQSAPGFTPVVTYKPTLVPQGNGRYLIEPGRPQVAQREAELGTREFAARTGISQRHVVTLCDEGKIKHRRKSLKWKSEYLIPMSELDRYLRISETEERP